MELTAHQESKVTCISYDFRFDNCKIVDRADHWSLLLRLKPILNHGTKASEELIYYLTNDLVYYFSYLFICIYILMICSNFIIPDHDKNLVENVSCFRSYYIELYGESKMM